MSARRSPTRRRPVQLRDLDHKTSISLPIYGTVEIPDVVAFPPRKHEAACCVSKMDDLGRLPIGYCGPDCERRPKRQT